jgi:hypothetical protein
MDKKHINENFLLDAMGTVLVGTVGLLGAGAVAIGVYEKTLNTKDKLLRKYKEIKNNRLDKKLQPILGRFANDSTIQDMYKSLPKYKDPFYAEDYEKQEQLNAQHIEQAKKIAEYIKSQLKPNELKYIKNITGVLNAPYQDLNENKTNKNLNKMQVEKLRSLIRESINEYIKEIDIAAEGAAMEARITKCEEAIVEREDRLGSIAESDHKDLIDGSKIRDIENEIKVLKKAKAKFEKQREKMQAKKDKKTNPEKKVTTDAPVKEGDVAAEMNMDQNAIIPEMNKEETLNESFIRMQKIAGIIK